MSPVAGVLICGDAIELCIWNVEGVTCSEEISGTYNETKSKHQHVC